MLFLDEIGELPLSSQAALLRVIQEQEVLPIGDDKPVKVDLRLCVATHRDLQQLVDRGEFREDLFARISGFTLVMPPLRERRGDFGILLRALLARLPNAKHLTFSVGAMRRLLTYRWRLNVRELEKVLTTVTALSGGNTVEAAHLDDLLAPPRRPDPPVDAARQASARSPEDEALRQQLVGLLTVHNGNVVAVSRAIGARRPQIYRWAERLDIDIAEFRR
jgi:transcriptional regulator with GAF, ATPase, and Fis domain